ncbi:GUN4 domain-containing protein [Microcoleus vaginatus GB1-A2]|uniref:GUN4 domain-containing protein n=1 Tax=Microcoleus vaginatus TaxID=119532 RepID=UPI00168514A1|nr:GUN4 domain-containing protein [Microcoleus sp. FACHB-61]
MGKNLAISIGINKYDFLQPLKYAKRDAELMQGFLRNQVGCEKLLFFSDDSPDFMGSSTRPYFTKLTQVLRTMFEKPFMEAGDNFWFFFSGHGRRHNGCDYLMACDSDPDDVERTAISINYVTEQLRRSGADNVILILDACRDQGSKSGEGIGNQSAELARQKGVITFFSCSPNELSYEIDALQQGAFTKALLEGLGVQGKCATVERLDHYLSSRVPELIRQHKSKKVRQTPYVIAEPLTKSHLIICPQYATLYDVSKMKVDAFSAEHQDYELAEQLWIRVLAASPGDMDAIKGIQRIAVSRIGNQASAQNNFVAATVDKRSESPLSAKSTPLVNTIPNEADVPLNSARGIDYTNLRDLLAARRWKEADRETLKVILKAAGEEEEWIYMENFEEFPCEDLRTIDQLWVKYSNGHFGFSVQKRIYQSLGGTSQKDEAIWERFGDKVGWRKNGKWLHYNDLTFSERNTAPGHLPLAVVGRGSECIELWWLWCSELCWWLCWLE